MTAEIHRMIPIPADRVLNRIRKGKKVRLKNAIIKGDLDIRQLDLQTQHIARTKWQKDIGLKEDVKLIESSINISDSIIEGIVNFDNSDLRNNVEFIDATFSEDVRFNGAIFSENARFNGATFCLDAEFNGATFSQFARFDDAIFCLFAIFDGATFNWDAEFNGATFSLDAVFNGATFGRDAWFNGAIFVKDANFFVATFSGDTGFDGATFSKYAWFKGATFSGKYLTFKKAKFKHVDSQESVARTAKMILENAGDKDESDQNFYLEMDAKRRKKNPHIRYPELLFVQWIFGYGVHPFRLMFVWVLVVLSFGLIYYRGQFLEESATLAECIYFSLTSAATPGYGGYHPKKELICQAIAGLEAILGTFMWASFLATFARKFSR